ncbi:hypothetical protein GCM10023238_07020 [Streptomyces heliomycini]
MREFIDGLVSHYVLDGGRLVVCHAVCREVPTAAPRRVRSHASTDDTTGETDEFGRPCAIVGEDYAAGRRRLRPHPRPEATWLNNDSSAWTPAPSSRASSRAALAGAETGRRVRPSGLVTSGRPLRTEAAATRAVRWTWSDVHGAASSRTGTTPDIAPRGETRRGPGGHEPLRDRTAACGVPPPTMAPTATSHLETATGAPAERSPSTRGTAGPVVLRGKHMGSRAVALVL